MPPRIPPILPPPHGPDPLEDTRRFKRRRLDSDRPSGEFKTIRYGKQGQVEPGTLTMELVSCDGGIYDEDPNHLPENVLKNDDSVYCTKGNRCNIVLRHHGGTVFSVKELVIKAPKSRFSAPVREGMVFVALEADERFARTTQYQIQFQPARVQSRSGSTLYSQQQEDGSHIPRYYARHRRPYEYGAEDEDEDDDDDEDDDEEEEDEEDEEGDHSLAQIPPEFTISHNLHTVTTELSDDESNEDAPHRGLPRRRTPNRIGSLSFESESSDDGMGPNWEGRHFPMWAPLTENTFGSGRHHHYGSHGSASRAAASSSSHGPASSGRSSREIQPSTGGSGTQDVAQDSARSNGNSELLSPLAHFFIKKGKSRCTIHFDPPISARYLLLKMWCPEGDGCGKNIDIQAVIVKGFAGPRFSPAFELA
ncbi:uncharacterized protein CTHT_0025840 [Thermochaetoides thermophila DSM 1495]|uniref:Uncharacterized protein n=1 Tax=Chaetomium thermophilum (strain DSM 1495 / CBS 144.50 / IMI 039719) TaxID=759272 RepID=G0S684_CHATD|nr:hypothetical protein CTHT_0025840 [Thermochaetoides thermophila DSM 1495]EGS20748.1 hypothetical protein CTHT_0025840 [Thermochaetoides thermophila DSM 1495]